MSPTYTREQTTFLFSMWTNLAGTAQGTVDELEALIADKLDAHLKDGIPKMGVWNRVWGPAVYQAPFSNVADNVMYVVRSAEPGGRLVVAIAGTNSASAFDILIEDLYVSQQLPWLTGTPPPESTPRIAAGTFIGLLALQFLRPGPAMPGGGQRLTDFLQGAVGGSSDITITGHSLGGTLSVVLSLLLHETQADWDPARRAVIYSQPGAGLTAGNSDFANYYDSVLGARTTRIYNSIDTIPHFWHEADLAAIPALYVPDIPQDATVQAIVAAAQLAASGGDYTQTNRATPALKGTVDTKLIDPKQSAFQNFLTQSGYQHTMAYAVLMGILMGPEAQAAVDAVMGAQAAARAGARLQAQLTRRRAV